MQFVEWIIGMSQSVDLKGSQNHPKAVPNPSPRPKSEASIPGVHLRCPVGIPLFSGINFHKETESGERPSSRHWGVHPAPFFLRS